MRVIFSPTAEVDLLEIAAYVAKDNPARALSFVDELAAKCLRLGHAAGIGTARPELGEGIRMLPHGRYLIFYREHEATVRVERIVHGARDIGGDVFDIEG